jgi:hypothetical protein
MFVAFHVALAVTKNSIKSFAVVFQSSQVTSKLIFRFVAEQGNIAHMHKPFGIQVCAAGTNGVLATFANWCQCSLSKI